MGGANSTLFHAIAKRLTIICVAHEQAAAMAANGHYQVWGRIAPVLPTAGAGCVNTFTGVMAAHMDGIPLLVISGNEKLQFFKTPQKRGIGFQGFNPANVVGSFTKCVVSVDNALGAKCALDSLYRIALEPRQGACWVDIPQDIAAAEST